MQSYQVPLREHWAILDGLAYVKDHLDGDAVVPVVVPDGHLRQAVGMTIQRRA